MTDSNASADMQPGAGVASRAAAMRLMDALLDKQPFDQAFDQQCKGLEGRDRAFVRATVFAALRHLGQIDGLLAQYCTQAIPGKLSESRQALRLGVAQLLVLRQPPHAVVHSWVEAVKTTRARSLQGLVNAVLRRVVREGASLPVLDGEKHWPAWLWDSWKAAYGAERVTRWLALLQQEPPLDITLKPDATLAPEGMVLPNGGRRLTQAGDVAALPGYQEGHWWVQDWAASLPVMLLPKLQGLRVLDVCAAPGGKTAQMAALGGKVMALDRSAARMRRLEENMRRLNLTVDTKVIDAREYGAGAGFDAVLLDAPCSATGTLRRHPELPYTKGPKDVEAMVKMQAGLLKKAAGWVAPGGTLLYCTCSLQPEEGEQQIKAFLAAYPLYKRAPVTAEELPEDLREAVTPQGDVRLLPDYWAESGGMDGFFMARMQRA